LFALSADFYRLDAEDDGGPYFFGSVAVPADALGTPRVLGFVENEQVFGGDYIVATATDASGNTSEFSPAYQVPEPGLAYSFATMLLTLGWLRLGRARP
jgi:hypothetical protein